MFPLLLDGQQSNTVPTLEEIGLFSFPCLLKAAKVNSVPCLDAASGLQGVVPAVCTGEIAASELLEKALQGESG